MKNLLFTLALVFAVQFSFGQANDAFKKDALKLIEAGGAAKMFAGLKDQILPQIPADKQAAFTVEFDATLPALKESIAKAYMEVYTQEDVKQLLAFYNTPIGKKMSEKASELSQKSQAAGMEWGQNLQSMMMKYAE
jgi:hypothetical protein